MKKTIQDSYKEFCHSYFEWDTNFNDFCGLTLAKKADFAFNLFLVIKGLRPACYFGIRERFKDKTFNDLIEIIENLGFPKLTFTKVFSKNEELNKTIFYLKDSDLSESEVTSCFSKNFIDHEKLGRILGYAQPHNIESSFQNYEQNLTPSTSYQVSYYLYSKASNQNRCQFQTEFCPNSVNLEELKEIKEKYDQFAKDLGEEKVELVITTTQTTKQRY
ncbi:MAG: hypothetical protein NXH75_13405 [Halobacteriovoraceae bacterium]|nr:hypothetical protein [Halobacteriovoraceae bacterium]